MLTADIKRRFLTSFQTADHRLLPSAPLVADGDPGRPFVDAGAVPFVPYLLGDGVPPAERMACVQQCLAVEGADDVAVAEGSALGAVDPRRATFFQVCAGFAVAVQTPDQDCGQDRGQASLPGVATAATTAWRLITDSVDAGGLGIDGDRITVVVGDDEAAADLWQREIGLPRHRVLRRAGSAGNWSLSRPGPCGPASRLYFDHAPQLGSPGKIGSLRALGSPGEPGSPGASGDGPCGRPAADAGFGSGRYTQLLTVAAVLDRCDKAADAGDLAVVGRLPRCGVGSWFGLERLAAVAQGVEDLYEIDELAPIVHRAAELAGRPLGGLARSAPTLSRPDRLRLQVVADRVRAALMLLAGGVTPSTAGRGNTVRAILRQAVLAMRLLGRTGPVLPELLPVALECMTPSYPHLTAEFDRISGYAYGAEQAFDASLTAGSAALETAIADMGQTGQKRIAAGRVFDLHETYGFPIDMTLEIAGRHGLEVDRDGFRELLAGHGPSGARDDGSAEADAGAAVGPSLAEPSGYGTVLGTGGAVEFTGYLEVATESLVRAVLAPGGAPLAVAGEGQAAELVLDQTPFYPLGGGQLADTGRIVVADGVFEVEDVLRVLPGLIVHRGRVIVGEIRPGVEAYGEIDIVRRRAISRAHTATHLIHRAVQDRIGSGATQAGSRVAPGRLRFDFNAAYPVDAKVLHDVEQQVNEVLLDDLAVRAYYTTLERARQLGAVALFGDRYGEQVRLVEIGDYAMEACSGTHAARSGQVGLVKIISDTSIGSGVRRLDALVGLDAFNHLAMEHLLVGQLSGLLRVPKERIVERVEETVVQLRTAERDLQRLRTQAVLASAAALAGAVTSVGQVDLVAAEAPAECSSADARALAAEVHGRMRPDQPAVVALALRNAGKTSLVVSVNDAATGRGIAADALLERALCGRGGGDARYAQGGRTGTDQLPAMLDAVQKALATA